MAKLTSITSTFVFLGFLTFAVLHQTSAQVTITNSDIPIDQAIFKDHPECAGKYTSLVATCITESLAEAVQLASDAKKANCCPKWTNYECLKKLTDDAACKDVKDKLVAEFEKARTHMRDSVCKPEDHSCKNGTQEVAKLGFVVMILISVIRFCLF